MGSRKVKGSTYTVEPSAARLTESLRDVGYDFPTAMADLVDNSIAAKASRIDLRFRYADADSYVLVADNGGGMTTSGILEALRYGSRREYADMDLGHFGLGLKTASLSQCRRITVVTKPDSPLSVSASVITRTLDLNIVGENDAWLVISGHQSPGVDEAVDYLSGLDHGTVVVLEELDRVIGSAANPGAAKRRMNSAMSKTREHLEMVFHRYLEGYSGLPPVSISLESGADEGEAVVPWDPFATDEASTERLAAMRLPVQIDGRQVDVQLQRFVLPAKADFSSPEAFERMSGPLKWNRQQGLYIYRAGRLVQYGGWARIRSIDEHTKLARAALDFPTTLDSVFQINVSKMRVNLPADIRPMLEQPIQELCLSAARRYRLSGEGGRSQEPRSRTQSNTTWREVSFALRVAAEKAGELEAMESILNQVDGMDKELYQELLPGLS